MQAVGDGLLQQYQRIVPEVIKAPISDGIAAITTDIQANIAGAAQGLGTFLVGQVLQLFNTVTVVLRPDRSWEASKAPAPDLSGLI